MTPARRRGLLLLCFALVCGGLAASQVRERERRAEVTLGPLVPVVVAARDLPAEHRLAVGDLVVRRAPPRYVPPDTWGETAELLGARTAVPLVAGAYLSTAVLDGPADSGDGIELRPGERAVGIRARGAADAESGSRVDVVVTTDRDYGRGRTFVAIEDVELLARRGAVASLRVTARQAVYLTAVANSARAITLLARPPGDRRRIGATPIDLGSL